MRRLDEKEMRETVGGGASECVWGVFGVSLGLLGAAAITAATGGAGAGTLAIAGAYAPVAAAACGWFS